MAEERCSNGAVAEPEAPPLDTKESTGVLKEFKEDHDANLSAALEGVLKETAIAPEIERNYTEAPLRISSKDTVPNSSIFPPPGIGENVAPSDDISSLPAAVHPTPPSNSTDSEETENPHLIENKLPITLDPIPEHTTPLTVSERESSHTTTVSLPTVNQRIPDPSLLAAKDGDGPGSDVDLVSAETRPISEKDDSVFHDVIDNKTPAMLSSERLSTVTANESTSLGSSNDIFVSTKTSAENTVDPKPDAGSEPVSNQALIALQKIMPPNLGEDAKHIFQAATEKFFKGPKSQSFDFAPAISSTGVEQASTGKEDILKLTAANSSVKEDAETAEGESCKAEEKSEVVIPFHPSPPPVMVDSVDETIIDVVDTSSTEAHSNSIEFQSTPTEVEASLAEAHPSLTEALSEVHTNLTKMHISSAEVHTNLAEIHSYQSEVQKNPNTRLSEVETGVTKEHTCTNMSEVNSRMSKLQTSPAERNTSPAELHKKSSELHNSLTELHTSPTEPHTSPTNLHTSQTELHTSPNKLQAVSTEVLTSATEVNASQPKVHSYPDEAQTTILAESDTNSTKTVTYLTENNIDTSEVRKHNEDINIIPETPHPAPTPTQAELEVPRLENTSVDVHRVTTKDPPTSLELLSKEKPTTEVPIRQRDCSKDPATGKQTSKTAVKTVKPVLKTAARAPSNPQVPVANSGQSGSIAATTSASATSALSPRSDKSIKQIKSSRPASATSARGFHGDLSGATSVIGGLTASLTGPQRVAAARAAAAAAGLKRKVSSVATSSTLADGIRSPREKQSVTSTSSVVTAVTATNNSVVSSVQKRTSAVSGSSATSALHSNTARRGAAIDGNRASGHGGPSQLGIHGPHQKLKSSNDIKSLEETYCAVLKSFVDAKKEIHFKTKLAVEMFSEVERLRHIASTKFGKDLPLTENISGLPEVGNATRPATGAGEQMLSNEDSRTITVVESVLKAVTSQRTALLNEAIQHHAKLLACCCEAIGDEGSPMLFSEKVFADQLQARLSEATAAEQSRVAEVLRVLRTSLSDLDETKACIRDLRSQLELLNQENSNVTSNLADCTKELEESRMEFGKTTARRAAAEKETKILRLKLKEVETKAAAEEQKCKDLSNQVRSLEDKLRSKDSSVELRMKEAEKKLRERVAKEQEDNQRRIDESLKQLQLKESKFEATCHQLESNLANAKQLLEVRTMEKERVEEELRAISEKLSRVSMPRPAGTEISQCEREDILQRLHAMIDDENISTGPRLHEELQALADLLNERDRLITEKDFEIKRLKDLSNESGDSKVSKEAFLELQQTLTKLDTHNQHLHQELSKMHQDTAKRDRVMAEQEKVLVIRDQLIAQLQGSNSPAGNIGTAGTNANPVAIQKKMLELQTTVERQTVRIKALEAQLTKTEEHQDGLQNMRTRYERRIAQLEHALSDRQAANRSETIAKLRTFLQNNLGQ